MSTISFENATLLALAQESNFFGDVVRYSTIKKLTIQGDVLALTNQSGVKPILSGISGILDNIADYSDIQINNISFGNGRINSLTFAPSNDNWVQTSEYTADIEIHSTGDFATLAGSNYYNGLSYTNYDRITNFSEDFSYQNSEGKNSYTHNVSLQLISGAGNPISLAKVIAANLFANTNLTGFLGTYTGTKKKYYVESYNLETNECSWQENLEYGQDSGNYSLEFTHSLDTNEQGITNVTEAGNIKGLTLPIYQSAIDGLNEQKPLVYPRISGIFNAYFPVDVGPLFTQPLVQGYNINKYDGTISYNLQYTNNPLYTGLYTWEYTNELNKDNNGIYNVSEQGEVNGIGRKGSEKYTNCYNGYVTVTGGISTRLSEFFSSFGLTGNLITTSQSANKDHINGKIGYSRVDSRDDALQNGTFKKFELTINDGYPTYLVNSFNIITQKQIIQPSSGLSNLVQRNISVDAIGTRTGTLPTMLNEAKLRVADYTGYHDNSFIQSANYSLNRKSNRFSLQTTIVGTEEPPDFGDTTI